MGKVVFQAWLWLQELRDSDGGQDLVEYALLTTLIALSCIAGVRHVPSAVSGVFNNVSSSLA
ncbi:MAG: Flp family type IVb pilin [Terracidiphilus sp.]